MRVRKLVGAKTHCPQCKDAFSLYVHRMSIKRHGKCAFCVGLIKKTAKTNKYGAKKSTNAGKTFDSKMEGARYEQLLLLERAGRIKDIKLQVPYELIPSQRTKDGKAVQATKYIADFVYIDAQTGETIVEDVKGAETDVYKIKKKLMLHVHGIEIYETGAGGKAKTKTKRRKRRK